MSHPAGPPATSTPARRLALLCLTAAGVVYGDIGTSPLYALRECFLGPHAVPVTRENVLGVLSLIVWTLVIVVTIKYQVYVLKADNDGEGGILALMALATRTLRGKPWVAWNTASMAAGSKTGISVPARRSRCSMYLVSSSRPSPLRW